MPAVAVTPAPVVPVTPLSRLAGFDLALALVTLGRLGLGATLGEPLALDRLVEEVRDDPLTAGILGEAPGEQQPLGRDRLRQLVAEPVELDLGPGRGELVLGRQLALGELDRLVGLRQRVEAADLERGDDAQGGPGPPRAAGPAGPVDVDLGVLGERVVDDVADVGHVDAAGGDVGGDQKAERPVAELAHHVLARGLGQVARQRRGRVAVLRQDVGDQAGLLAGVAEHDRRGRILEHDHVEEVAGLDACAGRVERVVDLGRRDLVAREGDALGVAHVPAGDPLDLSRDRGREQAGLALLGAGREDRPDVLEEAHREHLVALIEDHRVDLREVEGAATDVIEDPAGGAHDRVDSGLERVELRSHGRAAVDREHVDGGVDGEADQLVTHLLGQLAGRQQDEQLDARLLGLARLEPVRQPRQAERAGLAAAGLRLDEHIGARDHRREAPALHGRGLGPTEGVDRRAEAHRHVELVPGSRSRCIGLRLWRWRCLGHGLGLGLGRNMSHSRGIRRAGRVVLLVVGPGLARRLDPQLRGGARRDLAGQPRDLGRIDRNRRVRGGGRRNHGLAGARGGLGGIRLGLVVRMGGCLRLVRRLLGPRGLGHREKPSSALSSARAAADCRLRSRSRA